MILLTSTMKFALASYGTRGDIEPCIVIGRELLRRGHEVRVAVPPNLVGLAEAAGFGATSYGPEGLAPELWTRDLWLGGFGQRSRCQGPFVGGGPS